MTRRSRKPRAARSRRRVHVECHRGIWRAVWREPTPDGTGTRRRRQSLQTRDETAAREKAAALERTLDLSADGASARALADEAYRPATAVADDWLAIKAQQLDGSRHVADLQSSLRCFLRWAPDGLRAHQLTTGLLTRYSEHVRAGTGWKPATQRARLRHLLEFVRWLHLRGVLADDPGATVPVPTRRRPKEIRTLDDDAVRRAVDAARLYSPDAVGLVLCPVLLGLRASETVRLLWRDVDLERRTLAVTGHDPDPAAGIAGARTKCESSVRTLPLEEPLASWLDAHRRLGHGPYVFMHPAAGHRAQLRGRLLGGLARVKDPVKRGRLLQRLADVLVEERETWRECAAAGGLERYREWPRKLGRWIRARGCPGWDCRVARHTFGTALARAGRTILRADDGQRLIRPLTTIDLQRIMGHASVATTERHYLGAFPVDVELDMADVLGLTADAGDDTLAG